MAVQSGTASIDSAQDNLASDKVLRPFLAPTFDPADYLNATLPAWTPSTSSRSSGAATNQPQSLNELNNQTQTLLSQLSAQLTRLSTQLTRLTDDILRSGGRLAYEVEILRGETGSLSDVLVDGLANELKRFVPGGLRPQLHVRTQSSVIPPSAENGSSAEAQEIVQGKNALQNQPKDPSTAADAIIRLRTLALVRDRLESVVKVFGAALDWTIPPSEVNMRSTFISVAGPEAENTEEREKRGKAWADKMRGELGSTVGTEGYEAALKRVEQFQDLAAVWKGTSEEKARLKFVESLRKIVEEKKNSSSQMGKKSSTGSRSYGLR